MYIPEKEPWLTLKLWLMKTTLYFSSDGKWWHHADVYFELPVGWNSVNIFLCPFPILLLAVYLFSSCWPLRVRTITLQEMNSFINVSGSDQAHFLTPPYSLSPAQIRATLNVKLFIKCNLGAHIILSYSPKFFFVQIVLHVNLQGHFWDYLYKTQTCWCKCLSKGHLVTCHP